MRHCMKLPRATLLVGALMLLRAAPTSAQSQDQGPISLTLEQCIDTALRQNPDLAMARAEVTAAEALQASARGNFGPKLKVEQNLIRWDSAATASLGEIPGLPTTIPPLSVRDQTTSAFSVSLVQPLVPLWGIYEGYRGAALGVDLAELRRAGAQRDIAYQVTEAFYRLLQAMRLVEVAEKSVDQVQAQVARADSFFSQGLVGRNDVLRAELGLAGARQRLIQARGNVALARGRLALMLGLPPGTPIAPTGADAAAPSQGSLAPKDVERRALDSRSEIQEVETRIQQARVGVRAAWSKMMPQSSVIASYQHNTGSKFQPENAYFVGLFLSWDVWEWGATYYGTREAKARLEEALSARSKVRDGVRLEALAAQVTLTTSAEVLEVARRAVAQAEESFRLESKRYEARANTSFDVLDAETQLTQVRAQEQAARYDYLIAEAALRRTIGEDPARTQEGRR